MEWMASARNMKNLNYSTIDPNNFNQDGALTQDSSMQLVVAIKNRMNNKNFTTFDA